MVALMYLEQTRQTLARMNHRFLIQSPLWEKLLNVPNARHRVRLSQVR